MNHPHAHLLCMGPEYLLKRYSGSTRSLPPGGGPAEGIMSNIDARFSQAQSDVQELPEKPGNMTLLRLYALFKQATEGDVHGDKPGFADIVGKYKYEAWASLKGTARDTAKQQYAELVDSLKNGEQS